MSDVPSSADTPGDDPIPAATPEAPPQPAAGSNKSRWVKVGFGAAIGSAAIAAALLYANRSNRNDRS